MKANYGTGSMDPSTPSPPKPSFACAIRNMQYDALRGADAIIAISPGSSSYCFKLLIKNKSLLISIVYGWGNIVYGNRHDSVYELANRMSGFQDDWNFSIMNTLNMPFGRCHLF